MSATRVLSVPPRLPVPAPVRPQWSEAPTVAYRDPGPAAESGPARRSRAGVVIDVVGRVGSLVTLAALLVVAGAVAGVVDGTLAGSVVPANTDNSGEHQVDSAAWTSYGAATAAGVVHPPR